MSRTNPPFMTGVPELLLHRLLSQREMYGYELVRQIQLATDTAIRLGEGVVYPSLYALERAGMLKAVPRRPLRSARHRPPPYPCRRGPAGRPAKVSI